MRVAVIGSGLSGLAAARALIRRGIKPVIIDAGMLLEPHIQQAVERMASTEPAGWQSQDKALIRQNKTLDGPGIPRKLVFGSDYIYARAHPEVGISGDGIIASPTLAKGGYGNAWGAALLSATDHDLAPDWPLTHAELEPHLRNIMSWMPLSAGDDGLARLFPTYTSHHGQLALPPQAEALRTDLAKLNEPRLAFGQARLGVHTQGTRACRHCGLCLSGCVYGSIFSPVDDLEALHKQGAVDYRPGWLVQQVRETGGKAVITARHLAGEHHESLSFDHVFLAAGAIGSTRIMLSSMQAYDAQIELIDSQKFLMPLFRLKGAAFDLDHMNSLASLFAELELPELGGNIMHMQLSTVSEFIVRKLGADRSRARAALLSPLLNRLIMAWCSLHSRHSGALGATLRRDGDGHERLEIAHLRLERARASVKLATRALMKLAPRFRSLALPMLAQASMPGAGNHTGGSFPMRAAPKARFDSDMLGRPQGYTRLHLVDSVVMPSIPATTIALLMMANADRIATEANLGP